MSGFDRRRVLRGMVGGGDAGMGFVHQSSMARDSEGEGVIMPLAMMRRAGRRWIGLRRMVQLDEHYRDGDGFGFLCRFFAVVLGFFVFVVVNDFVTMRDGIGVGGYRDSDFMFACGDCFAGGNLQVMDSSADVFLVAAKF